MLALRTHEGGFGWVGARSRLPSRSWPAAWSRLGRWSRRPGASAASADRSPCSRGRRQATPTSGRSSSPRSPADGRRDHRSRRVSCSRILARRRASRAGRATVRLRPAPLAVPADGLGPPWSLVASTWCDRRVSRPLAMLARPPAGGLRGGTHVVAASCHAAPDVNGFAVPLRAKDRAPVTSGPARMARRLRHRSLGAVALKG